MFASISMYCEMSISFPPEMIEKYIYKINISHLENAILKLEELQVIWP